MSELGGCMSEVDSVSGEVCWEDGNMPIAVAKSMTDAMAGFDFDKASRILKYLYPEDEGKYEVNELKDYVEAEMWRLYKDASLSNESNRWSEHKNFRIEYFDYNFRVSLDTVSWTTNM